ncbi:YgcG family protein [Nitrogeniibacter mangrovi]|uniref:YgcG family protein n=1 Tax=Nitrogeniibacter mangrovi TaxID=2016596 RepID=A0A6C1B3U9_9RHOO|nr:TPM domain-containing protein [Nitrogeniibacter mangrovi]QID17528.1 YgcG family protein [Nitrogeniibacter mangrovi]
MRADSRSGGLRAWLLLALALLAFAAGAQTLQPVPALQARVTDLTRTLSAGQRQALELRLSALEQEKGSQIGVLIVSTTRPEAIEQYGIRVVDAWKLGRKGVDDGALLLVAKDDHRVRIEVGRGLEGAIPDAYAKRIIAEQITPLFRQGQFYEGIDAGVAALTGLVNGEPLPAPRGERHVSRGFDLGDLLFTTLFVAIVIGPVLRAIFGRLFGGGVAGVLGAGFWYVQTSLLGMAGVGALVAGLIVLLSGGRGGSGPWTTGSGHGGGFGSHSGGWSGGGGGFSGGGGGFSGGGASGSW